MKWFLDITKQRREVQLFAIGYIGMWTIVIIGATLELTAVTFLILFIPLVILLAMASAYVVYATDWKPKATEENSQIRGKTK